MIHRRFVRSPATAPPWSRRCWQRPARSSCTPRGRAHILPAGRLAGMPPGAPVPPHHVRRRCAPSPRAAPTSCDAQPSPAWPVIEAPAAEDPRRLLRPFSAAPGPPRFPGADPGPGQSLPARTDSPVPTPPAALRPFGCREAAPATAGRHPGPSPSLPQPSRQAASHGRHRPTPPAPPAPPAEPPPIPIEAAPPPRERPPCRLEAPVRSTGPPAPWARLSLPPTQVRPWPSGSSTPPQAAVRSSGSRGRCPPAP